MAPRTLPGELCSEDLSWALALAIHHVRPLFRPVGFAGLQAIDQGVEEHQPDATLLTSLPDGDDELLRVSV